MTTPVAPAAGSLRIEGVTKRFPGVTALQGVSFEIAAGTCHAICGENGAGKSTLGKIISGLYAPDEGRIVLGGEPITEYSPREALRRGIAMVHQELAFCEQLSVAENLCLADIPREHGFVRFGEMERRAREMLATVGISGMDVRVPIGQLPIAQRQLVQIAAAVSAGARVIVFDEATSSLGQSESDRLQDLIRGLTRAGITCIYVSHRMPEILSLCDAVTVLRDGRHIETGPISQMNETRLIQLMIGRDLASYLPQTAPPAADRPRLVVESLSSPGKLRDISFSVRPGEILGLGGLVGAGRSELAMALFGLDREAKGAIRLNGNPVFPRSPREAIRLGIGLVPEDRKLQGLVLGLTSIHNFSLPNLGWLSRASWVMRTRERAAASAEFARIGLRQSAADRPAAALSGGNQQKIVLARWLAARSSVLILDEPTRGVDVGAKSEIHSLIARLAEEGTAVILISSELPELMALSNRILVLHGGRAVGEIAGSEATEESLLRMMLGDGS